METPCLPRASAFGLSPGLGSPDPLGRTEVDPIRTGIVSPALSGEPSPTLIASAQTMSIPSGTPDTTIVTYRPEFREAFERLNRDWLETHSLLEPTDVEHL